MDQYNKKYYSTYGLEPVPKKYLEKQELENLFKKPKRDTKINEPHFQLIKHNYVDQADILYLPNDNGYKYLLVVVDIGSRLTDAEPLGERSALRVKEAFEKIYARDILKIPNTIEVDSGSEFKGEVKKYFDDNNIRIKVAKPGRHRQMGLVERRNQIIGKLLFKKMTAEELLTNKVSKKWVSMLPNIIIAMNKYYYKEYKENNNYNPICQDDACNVLEQGTKVRAMLDEPKNVMGKKQTGKFRSGDIRFDPKIRTIEKVLLLPNTPPLYVLDDNSKPSGIEKVGYTKNQLQVIKNDEMSPPGEIIFNEETIKNPEMTWVVKKILEKKKIRNRWMLKISWKGFDSKHDTWEPYSEIKKFYPDLVKEFDIKNK